MTKPPSGCELIIRVNPKASRDRVDNSGVVLKVYTSSPPADGEANKAVIKLLSKSLKIPKSRFSIKRGESSRDKLIWLEGVEPKELAAKLKLI